MITAPEAPAATAPMAKKSAFSAPPLNACTPAGPTPPLLPPCYNSCVANSAVPEPVGYAALVMIPQEERRSPHFGHGGKD